MRVNIALLVPEAYTIAHLFDDIIIRPIYLALRDLYYDVTIKFNTVDPDCLNILVGTHMLGEQDVPMFEDIPNYIILQSEILREEGGLSFIKDPIWYEKIYLPILQRARIVWDFHQPNIDILSDQLERPPLMFRGGYHPELETVDQWSSHKKDIDFLFIGSPTAHRREVMARLRQTGASTAVVYDRRSIYRDNMMARAKVNVCPIQGLLGDLWVNHLPWTRANLVLNNQGCLAVEKPRTMGPWEECVSSVAKEGEFIEMCTDLLVDDLWQKVARVDHDIFSRKLRISMHVQKLMRESL